MNVVLKEWNLVLGVDEGHVTHPVWSYEKNYPGSFCGFKEWINPLLWLARSGVGVTVKLVKPELALDYLKRNLRVPGPCLVKSNTLDGDKVVDVWVPGGEWQIRNIPGSNAILIDWLCVTCVRIGHTIYSCEGKFYMSKVSKGKKFIINDRGYSTPCKSLTPLHMAECLARGIYREKDFEWKKISLD